MGEKPAKRRYVLYLLPDTHDALRRHVKLKQAENGRDLTMSRFVEGLIREALGLD